MKLFTSFQRSKWNNTSKITICLWMVKDVFLNCLICFACQTFYETVKRAETECINILNCTSAGSGKVFKVDIYYNKFYDNFIPEDGSTNSCVECKRREGPENE